MLLYATNTSEGVMAIKGSGQAGRVRVKNVGDIGETSLKLWPGVTVSTGRNATNRTSVRQMIAAVMRSDEASMKIDTYKTLVELDIGTRTVDSVRSRSDPHLEETSLLTFFLPTRLERSLPSIDRGTNLRELSTQPIDTDAIKLKNHATLTGAIPNRRRTRVYRVAKARTAKLRGVSERPRDEDWEETGGTRGKRRPTSSRDSTNCATDPEA